MRKAILISIVLAFTIPALAQVQVRPLPRKGFEKRIREYVDKMKVVDTHEHIRSLQVLKDNGLGAVDFSLLFYHYGNKDLVSAGMSDKETGKLFSNSLSPQEKWQIIKPYWNASSNTAYNREVLLAADQLFGVKDIDSSTVEILSEKIRKAYLDPEKWYNQILKDRCGIDYVILDRWNWDDKDFYDPSYYKFVTRFDKYISINSKADIENFSEWKRDGVNSVDDLDTALGKAFQAAMNDGMVAVKCAEAYQRILLFENVKKEKADEVFRKIKNLPDKEHLAFDEVKPLQDYIMHRVIDLAKANNLPVQFHTGLQDGNGYPSQIIENSKPTHLVNLFQEYPDVKFILFHGSYPYGGELSTLAKNFRNVYIDMCWMYIISPTYSERYLNEWLETVPANKIMAFGGDFYNVEGTFGHLVMAKQVISNVLTAKVRDGYFTEAEALKVAQMILHDNAVRILNLK